MRTILVPLDRSRLAEQALPVARSLARALGARVEWALVHRKLEGGLAYRSDTDSRVREHKHVHLQRLGERLFQRHGLPVEHVLRSGPVASSLEEEVDLGGANLVYDYLIVATGAAPAPSVIPGLARHGLRVFSVEDMLRLRRGFRGLRDRAMAAGWGALGYGDWDGGWWAVTSCGGSGGASPSAPVLYGTAWRPGGMSSPGSWRREGEAAVDLLTAAIVVLVLAIFTALVLAVLSGWVSALGGG